MKFNPPSDMLPDQEHLLAFRPSLRIQFDSPQQLAGRFYISWIVRNVGAGVARKIRLFIPGIMTDALDQPLEPKEQIRRRTLFEDKHAFVGLMKPPVHLITEFEDYAGNVYRQYANVRQPWGEDDQFYAYASEELDRPYLVADRIVSLERTAEASDVLPEPGDSASAEVTPSGSLVGRITFQKLTEATDAAEQAGQFTVAVKMYREMPEATNLRQQTFELVTTMRKALIRYHGGLDVDSFVSPEITKVFTDRLLAVKNKLEKVLNRRVLRPQSQLPVTVHRMAMFLDDIEGGATRLERDIPPIVSP